MSEQANAPLPHDIAAAAGSRAVTGAALVSFATITTILVIYYETTQSMVSIWERSDTFAHCFLIAPISAWLIWRQRKQLMKLEVRPNPWALTILIVLGFGWLLAALAHVLVFQQYFLVAMIAAAVWSILGNRLTWAIAFPLAYLLLAVPFGEALLPALINFTANFTVTALQLTGIPVYREGTFFALPTGNWSVVEACSGLRYLIASFTLGTLYAYLTYDSMKRRFAFIALSLIVPIVANGIRAYLIVMLGHLSSMRVAVGTDHLVYGWLFFGLVMLLLFWIGSFWREDEHMKETVEANAGPGVVHPASLKPAAGVALAVIAVALLWPAYGNYLERDAAIADSAKIDIPGMPGKWDASSTELSNWKPGYVGTPVRFMRTYQKGGYSVGVYIAEYRNQRPGSQLITSGNVLVPESDLEWHSISEQTRSIVVGSQPFTVRQTQLKSQSRKLLVWRWYRLATEDTTSPYMAKIILAKHKLLDRGDDGAEIIIAAPFQDNPSEAAPVLQVFLNDMMPAIRKGLVNATGH